jgi:hypothetical protein
MKSFTLAINGFFDKFFVNFLFFFLRNTNSFIFLHIPLDTLKTEINLCNIQRFSPYLIENSFQTIRKAKRKRMAHTSTPREMSGNLEVI